MKAVLVVAVFCLALSVTMAVLLKGAILGLGLGALSRGGGYGGYGGSGYGPSYGYGRGFGYGGGFGGPYGGFYG
ncbi:unnamed protein product [Ixodes pacificus]